MTEQETIQGRKTSKGREADEGAKTEAETVREDAAKNSTKENETNRLSFRAVGRLLELAKPHRMILAISGVFMLLSTAVSLSLPLFARSALNQVLQTRNPSALDRLTLQLLGLIALTAVFAFTPYLLISLVSNRIVRDVRARLFAHLLRLPVVYFDRVRSGDIASHLSNDVSLLQQSLTDDLVRLVSNTVTLAGGIGLALYINARLTGIVVASLAIALGIVAALGFRVRRLTRANLDALADTMGGMTEALGNVRLVKAFARETYESERAGTNLQNVYALAVRSGRFEAGLGTVASVGFLGILIGVVWYGGRAVLTGSLSPGSLLAFLLTVTLISGPMASLASQYARLQRSLGAAERVFAILDEAEEPADARNARPFPDGPGQVEIADAHFGYALDLPVLNGLNLNLPCGKVTALVGASGAGKSTLAALLYRFYELDSGRICIDGVPIDAIRRNALREQVGIVPQEPTLFNATLGDNIRYGRLDATEEEMQAAARAAHVSEFADNLPDGYDTIIGERGVTLSGGQKQRVAIARAILKNPRILILDEATSALDTRSETLVRDALERLMRGRTTLVIAHRMTTVRNADQIAVLDGGQIVERGTHAELIGSAGAYAALNRQGEVQSDK